VLEEALQEVVQRVGDGFTFKEVAEKFRECPCSRNVTYMLCS
jgi:hypothetical protein